MSVDEIDLYQFAKLFDAALASDNETVKKALRNFMLVASIVEAEAGSGQTGPMVDVFKKIDELGKQVSELKMMVQAIQISNQRIGENSYLDWYGKNRWEDPGTYTTGTATDVSVTNQDLLDLYKQFGSTKGKI